MQTTPASLEAAFYSFDARFASAFTKAKPWYQQLATVVPSTSRENRYYWMGQLAKMREWIGERYVNNLAARGYTLPNKDFEVTIEVDRNDIEDDNLGIYAPMFDMMGYQTAKWPDDVLASTIKSGTTVTGHDGQYFFDTDHPVNLDDTSGGTFANLLTSSPLTPANYQAARQAMMVFKGEDNRALSIIPDTLVVPPQLELQARQILNAEMIAPVAAFGINAAGGFQTNILRGSANLIVIPELADEPANWYLMDLSKPIKPFVFQMRKAPQFQSLNNSTDENVFWRKKYIYGADARGNAGFTIPFLAIKATAA